MPGNDASSKPLQCSRRLPATNAASDRRVSTFPPGEKILIFRRSASHIQTMIGKLATRDNSECLAFRRFTPTFYLRVIFQRLCISSFQVSVSPCPRVPASPRPRVSVSPRRFYLAKPSCKICESLQISSFPMSSIMYCTTGMSSTVIAIAMRPRRV